MKKKIFALIALLSALASFPASAKWVQDEYGWRWQMNDGSFVLGQTIMDGTGDEYFADNDGYIYTNKWIPKAAVLYPDETGKYQVVDGYWYYVDDSGKFLSNTKTPDGYTLDKNGRWVNNGKPVAITIEEYNNFWDNNRHAGGNRGASSTTTSNNSSSSTSSTEAFSN